MKNKIGVKLYLHTLKQLVIPAVILGSICIVATVLNMFQPDINTPVYSVEIFIGQHFSKFYNGQPIAAAIAPALIVFMYIGSVVFTFLCFKHLNSRTSSDFYHSLPYTRISGFISRILAVLTLQYGIVLISMGAAVITMAGSGVAFDASFIPKLIFSYMAGSTLIVGGVALAMSLTGNLAANAMMALVILVLPRTLLFIAGRMIIYANYYGFINISTMGIFLNPVSNIPMAALMDITRIWEYYGLSEILINVKAAVYSFSLGIIYLGIALFSMNKRKSELAGNGVGTDVMRHILSALVSLPFLAFGFHRMVNYGVFSVKNPGNIQQLAVFCAIGLVIFTVSEYILKKQLKKTLKSLPVFVITGIVAFALIFAQKEMALRIINKVPDFEDIEHVKIDQNYAVVYKYKPLYTYSNLLTKDIEFEDEELIRIVRDSLGRMTQGYDERRQHGNPIVYRTTELYCEFKLKNGRSIFRNVYLYDDTLDGLWNRISTNPEFKKLSVALPPKQEVDDIGVYFNMGLDETYKAEFYSQYKSEFEALPTVTKNSIMNGRSSTLYRRFYEYYEYDPSFMNISNFTVYGNIGGYNYSSSYNICNRVPEASKYYMRAVNSAACDQFFSDIANIKASDEAAAYYNIRFEVLNSGSESDGLYRGFDFNYDGVSGYTHGNYISRQKFGEMLSPVNEGDLKNIDFSSPISVITVSKRDADPSYSLYYHVYAQLSQEEAEKLYDIYVELYK